MVELKPKEKLKFAENIKTAVKILKKGGVVVFPTDTVYGVGCKFDDQKAVDRIHQIKGTPKSQKMPILINDASYLQKLGCKVTKDAANLIKKFWPGALTLIFESNIGKIGLRIPNHPITLSLIKAAGFPIIGTSANFHGKPAPKSLEELDKNFLSKVDFVIKGKCKLGVESTVVDLTVKPFKIVRLGAVKIEF